jgi:broad specificity phosphatase PhoE
MCIYFVRHGMTDEDTTENDLVSGWRDTPINTQGRINAARAARKLKELRVTSITSSDTKRALQTAKIAGDYLGIPVVESDKLRSWNMGSLEGMQHTAASPFLAFFEKNPDVAVPNGEKFQTFYNRFKSAFVSLVAYSRKFPESTPAVFTHSQNLDLISWFIKGIEPGKEIEFGNGIKPGGILEVRIEGDKITTRKLRV